MTTPKRVVSVVAVAALTVTSFGGLGMASSTGAWPNPGARGPSDTRARAAAPNSKAGTARTVTLITGDVVRVGAGAPGREQITMVGRRGASSSAVTILRQAGHTYVIPLAARTMLHAGRLDPTLFDVTTLLKQGFDDQQASQLPLIVQSVGGPSATPHNSFVRTNRSLGSIGASAVRQVRSQAAAGWRTLNVESTQHIWLDQKVHALLDQSTKQIGAPVAWAKGLTGKGVKVAVADTGMDPTHPDLAGKIVASKNFSESSSVVDKDGHGTHVASTVAGTGKASSGKYRGVASGASLISAKVLDDYGSGEWSDVIAGMEWSVGQGAKVVSMSLGGGPSDGTSPVDLAVNRLSDSSGALFVVAAGNDGWFGPEQVSSPATATRALAVGAVERNDDLADFSSIGPRMTNGAIKPEITAPGVGIAAAWAAGTDSQDPVGTKYQRMSGTSMATPHVAGSAALLLQQHPKWTREQLRAALMSTAKVNPDRGVYEQGAGRVDVGHAVTTLLTTSLDKLELGYFKWPHGDLQPVSKLLTYKNNSKKGVTLKLSARSNAPAGKLILSATSLVIPAGSSRGVRVKLDPRGMPNEHYSGYLTALNGTEKLSTPIGWYIEPEMYDVNLRGFQRDGKGSNDDISVVSLDDPKWAPLTPPYFVNGTAKIRVPKGHYAFGSVIFDPTTDAQPELTTSIAVKGDVNIVRPTTVVLDARKAKPVKVSVTGAPATNDRSLSAGYVVGSGGTGISMGDLRAKIFATPTAETPLLKGKFEFTAGARLEAPPITMKAAGLPDLHLRAMPFATRYNGSSTMHVGKELAVVERDPNIPHYEQAKKAADAGAKLLVLYTKETPGQLRDWYWGEAASPIPIVTTTRTGAKALLALGSADVSVTGVAFSPFVYDVVVPTAGRIPSNPAVTRQHADFAKLDVRFGTPTATKDGSESRGGLTPMGVDHGPWLLPLFTTPAQRTDYVLGGNGVKWWQNYLPYNDGENSEVGLSEVPRTVKAGTKDRVRWFRPVLTHSVPRFGRDQWSRGVDHAEGTMYIGLGAFVDQADRVDEPTSDTHALRLSRNGTEIGSETIPFAEFDAPSGVAKYKLEFDSSRGLSWWKYSTKVSSVWSFTTAATGGAVPLVLVDYDVPAADGLSTVPIEKPIRIDLRTRYQSGAVGAGTIGTPVLSLSYDDGKTWTKLPVTGASGRFSATVTHPATVKGKSPSLRVDVLDSKGNRLTQTVTRAYGLR